MSLPDIPAFLRIPQEERKAAWDKFRAARPPLPAKSTLAPRIPLGDPADVDKTEPDAAG